GDHALAALLGRERHELVERAPLLERRGELVVLELEVDLGAGDVGEGARVQARGAHHVPLDHLRCCPYVLQLDHWKSTPGMRPEMISASARPEPAAIVQPSVP